MTLDILRPVVALAGWTLVVLIWLVFARAGGVKAKGIDLMKAPAGGRGQDLEGRVAARANWPAHNYAHLVEQPTVFYAVALVLAVAGAGGGMNAAIAWAYVGLRIVHSLWQMTVNTIPVRLLLFALSTVALAALTVHAAIAVF